MNCTSCGKELNAGENFCPHCGAAAPVIAEATSAPVLPRIDTTPILVHGILSLAFAVSFWLSWLGIIFGGMTRKKVRAYLDQGYELTGKPLVGKILGKIGTIVGIVMTVLFVLYVVYIVLIVVIFSAS